MRFALALLLVASPALARDLGEIPRGVTAEDRGSYALDHVSREFHGTCPDLPLVTYRGTSIRFERAVRVHEAFAPRIEALEELVREVAIRHYGRAPDRLRHKGTYNCRPIRIDPTQLSEHGLGNALDVAGFRFGAMPRGQELPEGLPRRLRRPFEVSILAHWSASRGVGAIHARFLADLRAELESRPEMFRGMLGPRFPGHRDHLHFDMAPWTLVYM